VAYAPLVEGEHLHAQIAQTFQYLKRRIAAGELIRPSGAWGCLPSARRPGMAQQAAG
jgi:hypothetical protein